MWVTYRDGVYDVTGYVKEHPGGPLILQGVGGPVDGFWAHWMQHHMSAKVRDALAQLRIGRLAEFSPNGADEEARTGGGIWSDERMQAGREANRQHTRRHCEMPYVSETRPSSVAPAYFTPNEAFFVRNHAPVPQVPAEEAGDHAVTFSLGGEDVATLSLEEIRRRCAPARVVSVLQCSGNRGEDNIAANGVRRSGFVGGPFEHIGLGLVGNAAWGGVRLRDLLREVFPEATQRWGSAPEALEGLHVTFEGLDGYSTSTPLAYVMNPANDCLLATEMNGSALPPDHGFPVRALLPGITGARNVKWVSRISVGPECTSGWNQKYYKNPKTKASLQELPMNSVVLSPLAGAAVEADAATVPVQGVAYAGGTGHRISRVDLSADRGKSWQAAECHAEEVPADDSSRPRGWVRFSADLVLPRGGASGHGGPLLEIWCRAHNDGGDVQPEVSDATGGYFYNGYHRVPLVRPVVVAA